MAKKGLAALLKTVNQVTNAGGNELPHDVLFLRDFNEALCMVEKEREQPPPPDGYFRPSSLYGCKRMLYYMQTGEALDTAKAEPNLIGIQESGTDRHARIQYVVGRMKSLGFDCEALDVEEEVKKARMMGINSEFIGWNDDHTEARCRNDDLFIYFQPDGVLLYRGRKYLLEIKTESNFTFNKRTAPKDEHLYHQATAYAAGMGIRHVLFFYEDRNITSKKPYIVTITDEMVENLRRKIFTVKRHVKHAVLPPKEDDKCNYCKYKQACRRDGETEVVLNHG